VDAGLGCRTSRVRCSKQLDNSLLSIFVAFRVIDATKLPSVTFVIHFNDGSKITVTVDFSTSPPTLQGRAEQRHRLASQHVPSTLPIGSILFNFAGPGNPTDQQDWTQLMTRLARRPNHAGAYWRAPNSPAACTASTRTTPKGGRRHTASRDGAQTHGTILQEHLPAMLAAL